MEPGELLSGRYRLLYRLGEGGMAEVWCAENERTGREFAIKVLHASLADNTLAVERFVREARATAQLRHRGIVDVYDAACTSDGRPYIVMELLRGESLEQRLARDRPLPPLTACRYLADVARALEVAHRAGIVHRDLSTPNVFLASSREQREPILKILDFGVVKMVGPEYEGRIRTGHGIVLGSPAYMSPEQAMGAEAVDHRTDVWSLGVLLYESLCGVPPFRAQNYNALLLSIVSAPHRPLAQVAPELDRELCEIVEGCLVKDHEARTSSAREVAEQLDRVARRLAIEATVQPARARRGSNRLPRIQPLGRPSATALGMDRRVLPAGVRLWQLVKRQKLSRPGLAGVCASTGAVLGLVLGLVLADPPADDSSSSARATSLLLKPKSLELSTAVSRVSLAENRAGADSDTDLVRAAARGLGLPPPRKKPRVVRKHTTVAPAIPVAQPLLADARDVP